MKLLHKENYKNYIIALVSLIISAIALPELPDQIPIHFNAQGVADGYGSPLMVFLFPGIILFLNILAEFTKHTDPRAANYAVFSKHYYLFFTVVDIFLFLSQLYIITYALKLVTLNISNAIIVAMGVLFIIIGNLMPKIKQNFFMGIKTPWALADEQVWYKTHRFSGKLWFVLGILICICGFLPADIMVVVLLVIMAVAVIVPLTASYIFFKRKDMK